MSYTYEELNAMEEAVNAPVPGTNGALGEFVWRDFLCANKECQAKYSTYLLKAISYEEWKAGPQIACGCCGGHNDRSALSVLDLGDWCGVEEITLDGSGDVEAEGRLAEIFERHARLQGDAEVPPAYPPITQEDIAAMKPVEDVEPALPNYSYQLVQHAAENCTEAFQKQAEDAIFGKSPLG